MKDCINCGRPNFSDTAYASPLCPLVRANPGGRYPLPYMSCWIPREEPPEHVSMDKRLEKLKPTKKYQEWVKSLLKRD